MVIPLFKSHFSIGKSILTLKEPGASSPEGADSIFDLVKKQGLKELFLVEDALVGFLQAMQVSEACGIKLRFGLRLSMVDSLGANEENGAHKIIIFSKNAQGCKLLNKIYSAAFTEGGGKIDTSRLRDLWSEEDLKLAIPFYDSFIFKNLLHFSNCVPDFSFTEPFYFQENNMLPLDPVLQSKISQYSSEPVMTKSIYYSRRKDFEAYQTYKCICGRQFYKKATLDNPNLDHCGSPEFSFESWQDTSQ